MSFSTEWEERYKASTHLSIWPWSDLVSYVMRYARPKTTANFKVLELGCGAGANIPFFKWLGVGYFAIEGSASIVATLKKQFPEFQENIAAGDFTNEIPFNETFDLIVDRASLTHNDTVSILRTLENLDQKMRSGSKYIGIDWFSTNHSDYKKGNKGGDRFSRIGIDDGQFTGVGCVHFSDKEHLVDLFKNFDIMMMEEKMVQRKIPADEHVFASWNLYAVRK
jgi:SAM-dependent methyltransferase